MKANVQKIVEKISLSRPIILSRAKLFGSLGELVNESLYSYVILEYAVYYVVLYSMQHSL